MTRSELEEKFGVPFRNADEWAGYAFEYEGATYVLHFSHAETTRKKTLKGLVESEQAWLLDEPLALRSPIAEYSTTELPDEVVVVASTEVPKLPLEVSIRMCQYEPESKYFKVQLIYTRGDVVERREDLRAPQSRSAALNQIDRKIVELFARGKGIVEE
jgi:hypothetical protein